MSAAYSLLKAIETVLSADSELETLGVTYYAGHAPVRAIPPYVVGMDQTENPSGITFGKGHRGTRNLHVWAKTETEALLIFDHLARILGDTTITIDGHDFLFEGELRLVGSLRDPSNLHHVIAEYACETKVAA